MDQTTLASVELFPLVLAMIVGVFIPHIVEFVSHSTAPWWVKSLLATALAVLTGVLTTTEWQGWDNWKVYVFNVLAAFVVAFTSQKAGLAVPVRNATGNIGLFRQSAAPPAHYSHNE